MIPLSTCKLRGFRFGDEASLQEHANNTAVWINLRNSFPHPFSLDDAINWIAQNNNYKKPINLAIVLNEKVIGGIGVTLQKDIYQMNAEIGYWLGQPFWNKGIMTEAVLAMVKYAFANFRIIRIYAGVFEYNIASMRVLEKAGFHKEAIHYKAMYKEGKVFDEHLFAILNPSADKLL